MEPAATSVRHFWISGLETAEGGELFGDAGCKGCCCTVFDVAEEVLDSTLISPASSASIAEGTWRNVLRVSVLS